jgi:PEP-CTERM motif
MKHKQRKSSAAALAIAVASLLGTAPPAQAFLLGEPVVTHPSILNPGTLDISGPAPSLVIFAYAEAADTSRLTLAGRDTPILSNKQNAIGDTVALGLLSGPQVFGLDDLTTGDSFRADVPDINSDFHAAYSMNCSDVGGCEAAYAMFGVGALNGVVATTIANLPAGTNVIFLGWEDRIAGDFDYNDLIFMVTNLVATRVSPLIQVPEPASLAMLAGALVGFSLLRRRRTA